MQTVRRSCTRMPSCCPVDSLKMEGACVCRVALLQRNDVSFVSDDDHHNRRLRESVLAEVAGCYCSTADDDTWRLHPYFIRADVQVGLRHFCSSRGNPSRKNEFTALIFYVDTFDIFSSEKTLLRPQGEPGIWLGQTLLVVSTPKILHMPTCVSVLHMPTCVSVCTSSHCNHGFPDFVHNPTPPTLLLGSSNVDNKGIPEGGL